MPLIIDFDADTIPMRQEWLTLLKQVGEAMLDDQAHTEAEVSVMLVDDAAIRELNNIWRKIDASTDVLSFPLSAPEDDDGPVWPGQPNLLGDVVICVPRAMAQAKDYGHSVERELGFLLTHGILHLLGYDHSTEHDENRMRQIQERVLGMFGLGAD